jgi:hypothetical protein
MDWLEMVRLHWPHWLLHVRECAPGVCSLEQQLVFTDLLLCFRHVKRQSVWIELPARVI